MRKTASELQSKSAQDLKTEEEKLREEIGKLRLEFVASVPKDTNVIAKKKKRLAVVLTVLAKKQAQERLQSLKEK